MPRKELYLVRGHNGRMSTIAAQTVNGAKKRYLVKRKPPKGSEFSIRRRGDTGDWVHYTVY